MNPAAIVGGVLIVVIAVAIVGIKLYQKKKRGESINVDQIINDYGDFIIKCLQEAVDVLQSNVEDFTSQEEYEKHIISKCVDIIKDNIDTSNVNPELMKLLSTETLTDILYKILHDNILTVFKHVDNKTIVDNKAIYDDLVVQVAEESLGQASGDVEADTSDSGSDKLEDDEKTGTPEVLPTYSDQEFPDNTEG